MTELSMINFYNANSRDTYFTIHNVKEAHILSKGEGVKVGIIDWLFDYNHNKQLYTDAIDFTGEVKALYEYEGHGLMMATVLKEIAPECEIYAINAIHYEDGKTIEEQDENRSTYFLKAIDWAIENKINILTYSQPKFTQGYQGIINISINKAFENGIITTFIHCDNKNNIFPYGCLKFSDNSFKREPDVNIYHFDYNTLFIKQYISYINSIKSDEAIKSGNDLPYFSFSSMSPVLAGFVALLKSKNIFLTSNECKEILIKTSYQITDEGQNWYDLNPCPRVVDIGKAVNYLLNTIDK